MGKNYFNFQSIVDEFVAVNGVKIVEDAEQAAQVLIELLNDRVTADQLNQHAQKIMLQNKGSLAKHIAVIDQYI